MNTSDTKVQSSMTGVTFFSAFLSCGCSDIDLALAFLCLVLVVTFSTLFYSFSPSPHSFHYNIFLHTYTPNNLVLKYITHARRCHIKIHDSLIP